MRDKKNNFKNILKERVKIYKKTEWEEYYKDHYQDSIKLPKFCKVCGSAMGGIVEKHD